MRTLIVSWKWNDLAEPAESPFQVCPVAGSGLDRLVRFHQGQGKDRIAQWLSEDQKQHQNAEAEYIVLMHSSWFSHEDINQLKIAVQEVPCSMEVLPFGSGNGFIYYNLQTASGLIDHDGNFADAHDKEVLIHDADGNICPPCFYKIWRHYRYRLKRQLDNLRIHTHRILHPVIESQGYSGSASTLLGQHKPEHLTNIENVFALLHKHYDDEPEALQQAQQLTQVLSEKHLAKGIDLIDISAQFDELLAAIREHDY